MWQRKKISGTVNVEEKVLRADLIFFDNEPKLNHLNRSTICWESIDNKIIAVFQVLHISEMPQNLNIKSWNV